MTSFLQVSDNSKTLAASGSLDNTTTPITLNDIDTTKFIPVTTGYAVTIWDDETYPDPSDDPNMEKALVTAATIDTSGSFTLTRPFAKQHSGTPRIALLVLAQHIKDHSTAINALETKTSNIDNTSDLNKPISTATQMALNGKEPTIVKGNLVAGNNISLTGTLASRLVGDGDVTIEATGIENNLIIGDIEPIPATGDQVLWLDTTGGNITLNLVTGD